MSSKDNKNEHIPTGKQIVAARGLIGLTQAELAAASGVSKSTVENYETGRKTPIPATVKSIVDALTRRGIRFNNGSSPSVTHDRGKAEIDL